MFWTRSVRNPFVDFPFLAKQFFEPPRALPEPGREIYLHCEQIPTSAPTFESGDCESVNPGDLYIFMVNSDDPDQVAIFLMTELQAGFEIYMTDNPWNGSGFEDTEGTVMVRPRAHEYVHMLTRSNLSHDKGSLTSAVSYLAQASNQARREPILWLRARPSVWI